MRACVCVCVCDPEGDARVGSAVVSARVGRFQCDVRTETRVSQLTSPHIIGRRNSENVGVDSRGEIRMRLGVWWE